MSWGTDMSLLQRCGDGTLSLVLCVRHAESGALAPVRSTDRRVARSSPTRWDDFVRGDSSGARANEGYDNSRL